MDGVFQGCSTDQIDKFFGNMIAFDVSMPHTSTRLSPITFQTFLIRNNILCVNQEQVYVAACKFWKRYSSLSSGMLEQCQGGKISMDTCEEPKPGWNKLIDYLNRVLALQNLFGNFVPYKMHYLAHICYLFAHEKFDDEHAGLCQKAIFHNIMCTMMYDNIIPTVNLVFAPILNSLDCRFNEALTLTYTRINHFIDGHCARTMNHKEFDIERLRALQEIVREGLQGIHDRKYDDDGNWEGSLLKCLTSSALIKSDVDVCELSDSFERDGMKCCKVLNKLMQARKLYSSNAFQNDPDGATDYLLDAWSLLKQGLESYNISTDKKEKTKS